MRRKTLTKIYITSIIVLTVVALHYMSEFDFRYNGMSSPSSLPVIITNAKQKNPSRTSIPPKTTMINSPLTYNSGGGKKLMGGESLTIPLWNYKETVFEKSPSTVQDVENKNTEDSFSACLLIADDNQRLPEWLAYHYWALPLLYLVVAIDPNSHASPYDIFLRWSQNSNMTIVLWNPTDQSLLKNSGDNSGGLISNAEKQNETVRLYKKMQFGFYHQCTMHLMKHNRSTWTAYSDIDEYLTINSDAVEGSQRLFSQPGSIMKIVKALTKGNNNQASAQRSEAGMDGFLHNVKPAWSNRFRKYKCLPLPRILFSAYESTADEVSRDVPYSWINASNFETLRWRYRAWSKKAGINVHHKRPKSIVDLSRMSLSGYEGRSFSMNAHKLFGRQFCSYPGNKPYSELLPLGFHHYLGGWESYSCRDDTRKDINLAGDVNFFSHNKDKWERSAFLKDGGPDDQVRPWIKGFAELVGEQTARVLLEGVGDYSHCSF